MPPPIPHLALAWFHRLRHIGKAADPTSPSQRPGAVQQHHGVTPGGPQQGIGHWAQWQAELQKKVRFKPENGRASWLVPALAARNDGTSLGHPGIQGCKQDTKVNIKKCSVGTFDKHLRWELQIFVKTVEAKGLTPHSHLPLARLYAPWILRRHPDAGT